MPGLKRNTHEMNFDGIGLIHLKIMLISGDMIHLFITEKIFIIGKKHIDIISDITNQNKLQRIKMILEIEYYKYDTYLSGKVDSFIELQKQINYIEERYDCETYNFIALMCRTYHWEIIEKHYSPDCVYDRDIKHLYKMRR